MSASTYHGRGPTRQKWANGQIQSEQEKVVDASDCTANIHSNQEHAMELTSQRTSKGEIWDSSSHNNAEPPPADLWDELLAQMNAMKLEEASLLEAIGQLRLGDEPQPDASVSEGVSTDLGDPAAMEAALAELDKPLPVRAKLPTYSKTGVVPKEQMKYGANTYSIYDAADHSALAEALNQRCHTTKRLLTMSVILPETKVSSIPKGLDKSDFMHAPAPKESEPKRKAVAIDCEMYGRGDPKDPKGKESSELLQLCAVDVMTGEILIDKLVRPAPPIASLRTKWHGVTKSAIFAAERKRTILKHWKAAREELFKFVDLETVIMGHSILNDFNSLRIFHGRIVDTSCLTAEAVLGACEKKLARTWNLQYLVKGLLKLDIQTKSNGHDCKEDTLATRELVLWTITHPDELKEWADEEWAAYQRTWAEKELKNAGRERTREADMVKRLKVDIEELKTQDNELQDENKRLGEEGHRMLRSFNSLIHEKKVLLEETNHRLEKIKRLEEVQVRLKWHLDHTAAPHSMASSPNKKRRWAKKPTWKTGDKAKPPVDKQAGQAAQGGAPAAGPPHLYRQSNY